MPFLSVTRVGRKWIVYQEKHIIDRNFYKKLLQYLRYYNRIERMKQSGASNTSILTIKTLKVCCK